MLSIAKRNRPTVFYFILWRVIPLSVLVMAGVWLAVRITAQRSLKAEVDRRLTIESAHIADTMSHQLSFVVASADNIAMNDLVVNSLIDFSSRGHYLPPFFDSLKIPGIPAAVIQLTDYRGRVIAANHGSAAGIGESAWYDRVARGHRYVEVSPQGIVVSAPVKYFNAVEGAVTITFGPDVFKRSIQNDRFNGRIAVVDGDGRPLSPVDAPFSPDGATLDALSADGWRVYASPFPDYPELQVVYAVEMEAALAQIDQLDRFILWAMLIDLLALLAGIFLSARLVSRPLVRFAGGIARITRTKDLETRIEETGALEYRTLAGTFNALLDDLRRTTISRDQLEQVVRERTRKLEAAHEKMVGQAMEAGRAQLSAMVLHNIGNAVTPLKVDVERLRSAWNSEAVEYLGKCVGDLSVNRARIDHYVNSDSRGKEVFDYLTVLARNLLKNANRQHRLVAEIDAGINYIGEIISLQQAYATGREEYREQVTLNTIVRDTLRMQQRAFENRNITILDDLASPSPLLLIDKNRLMQVLANVVSNSCDALEAAVGAGAAEKTIRLHTRRDDGQAVIEVADSGIGLDPTMLKDVFSYGRSGKGSSGFGLHYCRLFIEANAGEITIDSKGRLAGATVTIRLPAWQPAEETS